MSRVKKSVAVPTNVVNESAPYCVIGRRVQNTSKCNERSWYDNIDGATQRAVDLLVGQPSMTELLVVKIMRVVRKPRNHEILDVSYVKPQS